MRVAIIGYGSEGRSSAAYWAELGHEITVCDKSTTLDTSPHQQQLGSGYLAGLERFDLIVRSAGVNPTVLIEAGGDSIVTKITTNTDEFLAVSPSRNIIGVTGTKGKGTTSTLISHMLKATGHTVHLAGNIGLPPLELLRQHLTDSDWVVLELSSYQLADIRHSPHIAVCLLVEPEHQDWHGSVEAYVAAKQRIFKWQTADDKAIYFPLSPLSSEVAEACTADKLPYFAEPGARVEHDRVIIGGQTICTVNDIKLLGKHNWQNICAALTAVWQVTQDSAGLKRAISGFSGLPYRLELRGQKDGVSYYNDSFSSQPEATIAAIDAITAPKVLLLGGYDRGLDLTRLAAAIQAHSTTLRNVLIIGAAGPRIAAVLQAADFHNYEVSTLQDMPSLVRRARQLAQPGDAIVLSPGFPSFDMFRNFEDRGQQFNQVIAL